MSNVFEEKRKFNIVDALVIILAILCVVAVFLRSQISDLIGMGERTSEYKLSFKVSSISDSSYAYFCIDDNFWDRVYLDSPDLELGVIEGSTEKSPATVYMNNANGMPEAVVYPEGTYIDVTGIIKCNGVFKEDGCFYLSGIYAISPGDVLNVHTVGLDFSLTVVEIVPF